MASDDRDSALLHDMLRFSEEAVAYVAGLTYERYRKDQIRMHALERVLEIIGEAASHVTRSRQDANPEIPWKKVVGQRNVLAHMYGEIDQFQLFRTAREDLPGLAAILRKLLARS